MKVIICSYAMHADTGDLYADHPWILIVWIAASFHKSIYIQAMQYMYRLTERLYIIKCKVILEI